MSASFLFARRGATSLVWWVIWSIVPIVGAIGVTRGWSAQLFTLQDCVHTALENNPELRAQRYGHEALKEEKIKARAAFFPSLDIQSLYTRFGEPQRVIPAHANNEPGVFDRDLVDTALIGHLILFEGGRRRAAVRVAELKADQALWDLTASTHDLVLNVASVFYKILQLDQVLRATEGSLDALRAHEKLTRHELDVGRVAPVDLMKLQVRMSSLTQKLSALRADRQVLLVFLARLMGVNAEDRPFVNVSGSLEKPSPARLAHDQALKEAMENRPEIKAMRAAVQVALENVRAARAEHWPQVSAFGRYGLRHGLPYDADEPSHGLSHEDTWAAGVQVNVPLFRGGAVQAGLRQATLLAQRAREQLRASELAVRQDVERALTALKDALDRMDVTQAAVGVAQETLRIEQEKYVAGKSSINDVLDAQAALLQAEVEYAQAISDAQIAVLERDRALGRDLAQRFQ
ncbi:TolC family protein [Desulfosoma caldarium]|uniref:TolC family type I secretion outer membrane protein n=1 Tax=Desulfosoma caldarium TaxID=610254 RepID=A0A3N1USI6_9BACT|nr:TolC family protein [Desulfosoma caldarium]ROQ92359.1 TolC family type I secretion outer membrane protein [Desulfosoma caldarium]